MVDQATIITDVFGEIFDLLNSNVQTRTDSLGNSVTLRKSESGNHWHGAYPETKLITDRSQYPIGIINTPTPNENSTGWYYSNSTITTEITVFGTRAEHPPLFVQSVMETLRQNFDVLQKAGLKEIDFGQTSTNVTAGRGGDRGDLKIHEMTVPVELEFGVADFNTVAQG